MKRCPPPRAALLTRHSMDERLRLLVPLVVPVLVLPGNWHPHLLQVLEERLQAREDEGVSRGVDGEGKGKAGH